MSNHEPVIIKPVKDGEVKIELPRALSFVKLHSLCITDDEYKSKLFEKIVDKNPFVTVTTLLEGKEVNKSKIHLLSLMRPYHKLPIFELNNLIWGNDGVGNNHVISRVVVEVSENIKSAYLNVSISPEAKVF